MVDAEGILVGRLEPHHVLAELGRVEQLAENFRNQTPGAINGRVDGRPIDPNPGVPTHHGEVAV